MERKDTIKIQKYNTKMIAHRGLSGLERENTMAAFIAGGNRTYYGMECDIHPTTDHRYVIIHDDTTKRVATNEIAVANFSYEELKSISLVDAFDLEEKPYLKIPLFEDYLKVCIKYGKVAVIEYKIEYSKEQLFEVVEMVKSFGYLDHTVFISFFLNDLIPVREKYPEVKLQYLRSEYNQDILNTCITYRLGLDVHWGSVTEEMIQEFHRQGLEVNAWTVDKPEIGEKLASWGIDYITTDILE